MKYIYQLLSFFVLSFAQAQEPGAYAIEITNGKDEQENYITLLKHFVANGLEIDEKDDLFHTVIFEPIKYDFQRRNNNHWNYLIISAEFHGDTIIVTAKNKGRAQRKLQTIYEPKYPETVEAFSVMKKKLAGIDGTISYRVLPDYDSPKKPNYDDVYGTRRRNN